MIVIGLTGSIGMGKSTVANMLRDRDVPVHDADAAVHRLLGPGGGAVGVVGQAFPEVLLTDGAGVAQIDRAALGRIVFSDRAAKRQLEDLLHPVVRAQSDRFVADHRRQGAEMIALDIPLLFETRGEKRVDVTLCVSAPPDVQEQRVMARPDMTRAKFERILAGQMPDAEKRAKADYILETGKTLAETASDLDKILSEIKAKGAGA